MGRPSSAAFHSSANGGDEEPGEPSFIELPAEDWAA
jgi:hypothetical protein